MKKHEAMSVGDIIQQAISSTGHRDEYHKQQVCFLWGEVVGPYINKCTMHRFVSGTVMHVYLTSATLKAELSFQRQALVQKLNSLAGKEVITDISIH